MARLNELWRSVDGPGVPPTLDVKRVKARVNAALDADQAERKIYMKQKLRMALIAAAAVAALTGSAFAATTGWNGLSAWFRGDPAPVQEYVDSTVREVADKDYNLTVEGCVADESSAYLTVTITALSGEAREFLWNERFIDMDLFYVAPLCRAPKTGDSSEPMAYSGPGCHELECGTENARRFALDMWALPVSTTALRVRCGYMEEGKSIEVPLAPVPSRTVKIGAKGTGVLALAPTTLPEPETITISEIAFSPLTVHVKGSLGKANATEPNIRFRMADGSVRTQAQMLDAISWGGSSADYRFKEVQHPEDIVSFIVFDMEYPVDGSKPAPVEHDDSLDPITVTRMEKLSDKSGYSIPVRELTEKLGGTCDWAPATGSVTCVYRGVAVVLKAGEATALVDGKPVDMLAAPAEQNGVLAADSLVFTEAWSIDGFVQRANIYNEKDPTDVTTIWGDWYIIP